MDKSAARRLDRSGLYRKPSHRNLGLLVAIPVAGSNGGMDSDKPKGYFVRMGHGPIGSPEIYSGGPGYLITAGGVNRGERSLLVARPITLMLDDGATDLSQVLHLAGPGAEFRQRNNTGVWRDFAAAAGPVRIPETWKPDAEAELWKVFHRPVDRQFDRWPIMNFDD